VCVFVCGAEGVHVCVCLCVHLEVVGESQHFKN